VYAGTIFVHHDVSLYGSLHCALVRVISASTGVFLTMDLDQPTVRCPVPLNLWLFVADKGKLIPYRTLHVMVRFAVVKNFHCFDCNTTQHFQKPETVAALHECDHLRPSGVYYQSHSNEVLVAICHAQSNLAMRGGRRLWSCRAVYVAGRCDSGGCRFACAGEQTTGPHDVSDPCRLFD